MVFQNLFCPFINVYLHSLQLCLTKVVNFLLFIYLNFNETMARQLCLKKKKNTDIKIL